jgi:hypothetical protein
MAKTTAELTALTQLLQDQLAATKAEVTDLWDAHSQMLDQARTAREEQVRSQQEALETRRLLDEERNSGRTRDADLAKLREENSLLRQRFDDQSKRAETWANRAWGFFVVLVGALLTLASGLIVTLARK